MSKKFLSMMAGSCYRRRFSSLLGVGVLIFSTHGVRVSASEVEHGKLAEGVSELAVSGGSAVVDFGWLERMGKAFRQLNYDGRFVYLNGSQMNTLRVLHQFENGQRRERLIHLSGPRHEFVRQGDELICVHEGERVGQFSHRMPIKPLHTADQFSQSIAQHYRMVSQGDGRVADRTAKRIDLVPKDDTRYGYHLWLDDETGLLLKSVLFNHQGVPLEVFEFVELQVGKMLDAADLEPTTAENTYQLPLVSRDTRNASDDWRPAWLPQGFQMITNRFEAMVDDGPEVAQLVYTDGLSSFTLFIEPITQSLVSKGVFRRGASIAVSERLNVGDAPHLVTVVGEVPPHIAKKVAQSVQYR